ncbi:MAG: CopD family protein [Lautropia sp.]|nr:CopD family protein [Lautropia sp.]
MDFDAQWFYWTKIFHIVMVTSWFAGLFYLPRIFVNLAQVKADSHAERDRLLGMSRRLYRFMTPIGILALITGLILYLVFGIGMGTGSGWMHVKITIAVLLAGYHHSLSVLLKRFETGQNKKSETWFRVYNEVPVLLLIAAVALVIIKPF